MPLSDEKAEPEKTLSSWFAPQMYLVAQPVGEVSPRRPVSLPLILFTYSMMSGSLLNRVSCEIEKSCLMQEKTAGAALNLFARLLKELTPLLDVCSYERFFFAVHCRYLTHDPAQCLL